MANLRHGVARNDDLDPRLLRRETRPLRFRINDFIAEDGGVVFIALAVCIFLMPRIADLIALFAIAFFFYARGKRAGYKFRTPIYDKLRGKAAKGKKKPMGDGIFFLGNDMDDGSGIFFNDSDVRTHMLVFGSTGSGKTRFLLGMLYQAMVVGSGAMYVDGKADNTVFWLVYSLCRRLGREDDLLVINYLTGGVDNNDGKKDPQAAILSNTTNPFAHGSSEQLRSMIVGLMRESGGDGDMWKGRASALLGGLLRCLVAMRDKGEIQLNVQSIRDFMPLDRVLELTRRRDLSDYAIAPLRKYLLELPGYNEADAEEGELHAKCYEQHGYLTMQLTETLGDLGDTYGHIFNTPLGEVDFKDVVFNRRILFVMLPSLEKDPDALGNLGKLVVSGVRSALAPALGNALEGSRRDVIAVKPTNSPVPFLLILDEYGYYSVKGFAVVAAQARSLGISVVFAGQDYPSFKKGSEEEAASTVANTNIKICMKLEDPKDTYEIFEARAGKGQTTMTSGHEVKGAMANYLDMNTTRVEEKSRINIRDLVSQGPGQAHVIFGDELARCQMFYAEPTEVKEARLNRFLMVREPSKSTLDAINGSFTKLNALFGVDNKPRAPGLNAQHEAPVRERRDEALNHLIDDYRRAATIGHDLLESSVIAIGMVEHRARHIDQEAKEVASEEIKKTQARHGGERPGRVSEDHDQVNRRGEQRAEHPDDVDDEFNDPFLRDEDASEESLFKDDESTLGIKRDADNFARMFESSLDNVVLSNQFPEGVESTPGERAAAMPREHLKRIEMASGRDEQEAAREAERGVRLLSEAIDYPTTPVPVKGSAKDIGLSIANLMEKIGQSTFE